VPTYHYECRGCNTIFSQVRAIDDCDLPAICPNCPISATRRLFKGPTAIRIGSQKAEGPNRTPDPQARAAAEADGPWNVRMTNCTAIGCGTGIKAGGNIRILAQNTRLAGNQVGLDIGDDAVVRHYDTSIE
jgi:putative FmdB family regulatory protein